MPGAVINACVDRFAGANLVRASTLSSIQSHTTMVWSGTSDKMQSLVASLAMSIHTTPRSPSRDSVAIFCFDSRERRKTLGGWI
jgi:tRNA(His) 5'-end guanylyltransferase